MKEHSEHKDQGRKECGKYCGRHGSRIRIDNHVFSGALWFMGWLFAIGFLDLSFWRGVLAIAIWPYYLGVYIAQLIV